MFWHCGFPKRWLKMQPAACMAALAAYIDLNPVRAGIAGDPKD